MWGQGRWARVLGAVVTAALSGACSAPDVESTGGADPFGAPAHFHRESAGRHNPRARFRGHLLGGRELNGFVACGSSEVWWSTIESIHMPGLALLRINWRPGCFKQTGDPACQSSLYVELDGTASPPGNYGHMGWYGKQLRESRIYFAANSSPADCPLGWLSNSR